MPHGKELKHIQDRRNLPTDMTSKAISRTISPKIRAQSFFSARVAESNILSRFREITDSYMTGRIGRDEARNLMLEYARANNRDDGTRAITNLASSARLNLIVDQNASMAKAVGDYERMYSSVNKKLFPYVIYHASVGSRTPRSEHQRYDGMIFEKDDPWLKTHWPPWDFNCHCRLENCTNKKAHKTPDLIQPPTPADKVTVDTKSGYSFDPAHAFEKFDYSAIKDPDLQDKAKSGVEQILSEPGPTPAPVQEPEPVNPEQPYTAGEQKALEYAIGKIGDAKREHLLVFDPSGKVEYEETGKKQHVGYSPGEISYEGKIAIHNHPEGVFPFFSQQDLDTFHSKKIRMAATVSKDYIITIKKDENFLHEQSRIDITNGLYHRTANLRSQISETYRQLRTAKSKAEYDELRDRYIQLNLKLQSDIATDAGYKISWVKRDEENRDNFKFLDMLFGKSVPEKQVPEPAFDIKGMRGITEQTRLLIGNDNVNLEGITNETLANQMNYALHNVQGKYPQLKLTGVETDKTLADNTPMAMTHTNTLLINPDYFNGLLELMSQYKVKNGKYDIPGVAAMYKGHEMETLIYHECGHALYNQKGLVSPENPDARHRKAVLLQMFRRAKKDGVAKSISDYATQQHRDFFAEIIAAVNLDKREFPEYITIGIQEILR